MLRRRRSRKEYYLGIVLDRASKAVTIIATAEGGVEIEEMARTNPKAILRMPLDPLLGLQEHHVRRWLLPGDAGGGAAAFGGPRGRPPPSRADADLAEINPLVVTGGELVALDAKIVLDDSALSATRTLSRCATERGGAVRDRRREAGINFIKLDGTIGCMVNGAGLAMATMDLVKLAGGEPANFLDIGGGAKADRVAAAFLIILDDPNVRAILVNIFGGITRGDEVAAGHRGGRQRLDARGADGGAHRGHQCRGGEPILRRGEPDHRRFAGRRGSKAVVAGRAGARGRAAA